MTSLPSILDLLLKDDVQQLERLIREGSISLDSQDSHARTVLHNAVSVVLARRITARLLELGADVKARNKYGMGVLSEAVRVGNTEAVPLLLSAGADVNEQDNRGFTPLHHAAIAGKPNAREMIKLLLRVGADVRLETRAGESARAWLRGDKRYMDLLHDQA